MKRGENVKSLQNNGAFAEGFLEQERKGEQSQTNKSDVGKPLIIPQEPASTVQVFLSHHYSLERSIPVCKFKNRWKDIPCFPKMQDLTAKNLPLNYLPKFEHKISTKFGSPIKNDRSMLTKYWC